MASDTTVRRHRRGSLAELAADMRVDAAGMRVDRTMRVCRQGAAALLTLTLALTPGPLSGQAPGTDSTTVVAGPEYEAGSLQRFLLGSRYRDTWTTPVRVPVLDLGAYAGGLTPVQRGGGVQTRTLRFEAPDGREYNFRSVNKSYAHSVPEWARGTLIEWLRQDQTSAQHPGAAIVATPLIEAAGILHPGPQLAVMPDDPRLGEFRDEFAGLLGTIELHPNEGEDDEPLFAGSPTIAGGERLLEHLAEEPEHRLDAPAFLAERLISIFVGDWDRHIGQYRFARYQREDGVYWWVPIPEDRDYALLYHDGLLLAVARASLTSRLIRFRHTYPALTAMMSNSPDLVRNLLAPVDRATWDSVAHAVHARLTDEAIQEAVGALPPEWEALTGPELTRTLRARRARFLEMSREFYALVAAQAEVHATEEDDEAIIERHPDASVTVRLRAPGNEAWGDRPYYERRFVPAETREIRVFLSDGDDHALVRGSSNDDILVRVVGGEGDDVLTDSTGGVVLYDAEGDNTFVARRGTRVDQEPYEPPEEETSLLPNKPRDWGSTRSLFAPAVDWAPDAGLLVGGGPRWMRYGFRHAPYASENTIAALVNPGSWRGRVEYEGTFVPESSNRRIDLMATASNVDVLRFHGYGNASPALPDDAALTWRQRYDLAARMRLLLGAASGLAIGANVHYSNPEVEPATPLEQRRPRGADGIGEAGLRAAAWLDTRDDPRLPHRGFLADLDLSSYLPLRDSPDPFGNAAATGRTYLRLPVPASPVVALRVGGEVVMGDAPIHRAAFLGGRDDLRGFSQDRFAGDMAAHGGAELRVPVMPAQLIARGTVGLSAFTDAGRVWLEGASPGDWHTAVGASVWFSTPIATVTAEWARGEKDAFYLRLGTGL